MLINFILNGNRVSIDVPAYAPLSKILREEFSLNALKDACGKGYCGLCSVVLDKALVYSCLVPVFQVRDKEVLTMEGYARKKEFEDVLKGFKEAGVHLCDYCAPSRALATGILLDCFPRPDEKQMLEILSAVNCNCSPYETLKEGITLAARYRQRRRN